MQFWQVAAGDGTRDYATVFTRFGVLLTGPGTDGPYDARDRPYQRWSFVRKTAEVLQDGDLVALKRASGKRWQILAVGQVVGDYEWVENFEDVDGWDLQHARRIAWRLPSSPTFARLRQGTLARVANRSAQDTILATWEAGTDVLPETIPPLPEILHDDVLIEMLIDDGLRVSAAEEVARTLRRVRRLAGWYVRKGRDVSEHETRSFIVVPLLLALGWPEQQIKVEWKKLDLALFDRPYGQSGSEMVVIVETKRIHEGLWWAERQAQGYAKTYPTCRKLVVTNGITYKLLSRPSDSWMHTASMNLTRLRREHWYLQGVGGAASVFRALLPT